MEREEGKNLRNSFYLGTFTGNENGFVLKGVRVCGEPINPKTSLKFNPEEGLKNTTLSVKEMKNVWNNKQACVILLYGDSRIPMITTLFIFDPKTMGKGYQVEGKSEDEPL